MSVHQNNGYCSGCNTFLTNAHPYLQDWFYRIVKPLYPNAHISCSWRGPLDQEKAVKEKKSQLHWPHSAHNRTVAIDPSKPFDPAVLSPNSRKQSIALDLFQINEQGKAVFAPDFYFNINDANARYREPMIWGHVWKSLGDNDHFQLELSQVKSN